MGLRNNMSWFFGVFAFVALFAGSSFVFNGESPEQTQLIQFSDLSDADIDVIMSVKAKMQGANL